MVVIAREQVNRQLRPLPAGSMPEFRGVGTPPMFRRRQVSSFEAPAVTPAQQLASLIARLNAEAAQKLQLTPEQAASAPRIFRCHASECLLTDPVVLADGKTYQKDLAILWFKLHGATTPISGEPLSSKKMATNFIAASMIENWSRTSLLPYLEEECPDLMNCPISFEAMDHPVISLDSGQSYQEQSILKWFGAASSAMCPLTRRQIQKANLVENNFMQQAWSLRSANILAARKPSGLRRLIGYVSGRV